MQVVQSVACAYAEGVVSKHISSGSQIADIGGRGQPPRAGPQAIFLAGDRAWPLQKFPGDLSLKALPRQSPPSAKREYGYVDRFCESSFIDFGPRT
jgi:hypothetical protein